MVGLNALRSTLGAIAWVASRVSSVESRYKIRSRMYGAFSSGPCFWLHGASLGECKMLLSLAQILKRDVPEIPRILITTQKTEVLEFLKPAVEELGFETSLAPLDSPAVMRRFMESVQPVMLVLAENELWPGYLSAMRKAFEEPRVALISGRFFHCVDASDFGSIGFASMQTGADLARFMAASEYSFSAKAIVGGDWKLLRWAKFPEEMRLPRQADVDSAFVSFHREEIKPLCRMLLLALQKKEAVVLAPRFEEELPAFRDALCQKKMPTVEWPEVQKGAVSLVTEYGKLTEIFKVSRAAVIGGSYSRSLGIHDFWEPLKLGVVTYVGPYCRGQQASVEALLREGAVVRLRRPLDYASRTVPNPDAVCRFLSHEREKALSSYKAFLGFVRSTVLSVEQKYDLEGKV